MFNFLSTIIGNSLFTNAVELIVQLALFYGIYHVGSKRSKFWQAVCHRLSMFLVLETASQFFYILNATYLGLILPILVRVVIIGVVSIPLISLWISIPGWFLAHQKAKSKIIPNSQPLREKNTNIDSYAEVNARLHSTLARLNKNYSLHT
jgi:hypothetical protein